MRQIETDYLVVGAGASGMAFTDSLISHSEADVVLVDRRHRPGGHWNDDYPFVRLHAPSAMYGVSSRTLGHDRIDEAGPNAGFYERSTGAEICDYYSRVLDEVFLPTGRVRFLGMSDYRFGSDEHEVICRLTGETTTVRVRRKLVDATYMQTTLPSTHTPSYTVDPDARLVTPNDLVKLKDAGSGYTIIGAGKTSMDTCCWLMEQGVAPEAIRWIRPRDLWTMDRAMTQPLKLLGSTVELFASFVEATAQAEDVDDLLRRLEAAGALLRLDPDVEPQIFRGVILSEAERTALRRIRNVVRLGYVTHIASDRIELQEGSIPTDPSHIHVDCSARGVGLPPVRPVFEPDRITIQRVAFGNDPLSGAIIGYVEAVRDGDEVKNRLCPALPFTGEATNIAHTFLVSQRSRLAWSAEPDLSEWLNTTRLSPFRGVEAYVTDPAAQAALMGMLQNMVPSIENLERIVEEAASPAMA